MTGNKKQINQLNLEHLKTLLMAPAAQFYQETK